MGKNDILDKYLGIAPFSDDEEIYYYVSSEIFVNGIIRPNELALWAGHVDYMEDQMEFKKGMELIFKSLSDALKKQGIEEIAAEGEVFNPDLHYAVSTVEDEALGTNTVAAVLQKGYRLGDKVLRHAMVSVANP